MMGKFRPAIMIECEGSNLRTPHGHCQMCAMVSPTEIVPLHTRTDVLAMLERGDFDEVES